MTLRLSDKQTEALPQKAEAEHRSTQQVALATVDACSPKRPRCAANRFR